MNRYLCFATFAALVVPCVSDVRAQQLVSYHTITKTLATPPQDREYKHVITVDDFPSECSDAETLQIYGGILDASVIRLICQYSSLKEIVLSNTNIGDGELASILAHTDCGYLNVAGTNITNSSVVPLASEKSLRRLFVSSTGINREGREELRRLRPDLKLNSDP